MTLVCAQVASFGVGAVAHAAAYTVWRKRSEDAKMSKEWPFFGLFTQLAFLGCVAGAFAYGARIGNLSLIYSSRKLELLRDATVFELQKMNLQRSGENRWAAAFYLLYPFELSLVVAAQLLVVHRMQRLSSMMQQPVWVRLRRLFIAAIVLFNVIGIVGNIAAAVYFIQAADAADKAANAWATNSSATATGLQFQSGKRKTTAAAAAAVQRFSEMIMLLLISAAFLVVGVSSSRVISSALRTLSSAEQKVSHLVGSAGARSRQLIHDAGTEGRSLQRKIVATFVFVFFTVALRCVFSVMFAVALAFQDIDKSCAPSICDACYNIYSHITFWILYIPLFQQFVMLIASPLSLIVALWGMSNIRALEDVRAVQAPMQSAAVAPDHNCSIMDA